MTINDKTMTNGNADYRPIAVASEMPWHDDASFDDPPKKHPLLPTFRHWLAFERRCARMTQVDLAERIKRSQSHVSKWESGAAVITTADRRALVAVLPALRDAPRIRAAGSGVPAAVRRWLACVRAVRGAAYRVDLLDLLRLAQASGLTLTDVIEAVQ